MTNGRKQQSEQAEAFSKLVEELFWHKQEVALYLESRSRALSLHEMDDAALLNTPTKIVFEECCTPVAASSGLTSRSSGPL